MFNYHVFKGDPFSVIVYHDDFIYPMYKWAQYLEGTVTDINMTKDDTPAFLFQFPSIQALDMFIQGCQANVD